MIDEESPSNVSIEENSMSHEPPETPEPIDISSPSNALGSGTAGIFRPLTGLGSTRALGIPNWLILLNGAVSSSITTTFK